MCIRDRYETVVIKGRHGFSERLIVADKFTYPVMFGSGPTEAHVGRVRFFNAGFVLTGVDGRYSFFDCTVSKLFDFVQTTCSSLLWSKILRLALSGRFDPLNLDRYPDPVGRTATKRHKLVVGRLMKRDDPIRETKSFRKRSSNSRSSRSRTCVIS